MKWRQVVGPGPQEQEKGFQGLEGHQEVEGALQRGEGGHPGEEQGHQNPWGVAEGGAGRPLGEVGAGVVRLGQGWELHPR